MSDDEILKIAEVRRDILESKIKGRNFPDDQMALSIYYKMYSKISNDEVLLLNQIKNLNQLIG